MCCKVHLVSSLRCPWKCALPFSEVSILGLVLSMLIWCLFLNPALAVRGRRLLASGIPGHPDAVLSVFVSQCTRPHFLVDESRVPVCAGSNSVSFQHPTLLWDGRKSNCLPFHFSHACYCWGLINYQSRQNKALLTLHKRSSSGLSWMFCSWVVELREECVKLQGSCCAGTSKAAF